MNLRWGIVGAAAIAKNQVMPALFATNNKIQAIASRSQNISELVEQYQIEEIYDSYDKLLSSTSIDAVYIPLPNSLHFEWVMKALQNDLHVLVEKPIVLSEDEMRQIEALATEKGKVVVEAFMYRHHPQIEAAKQFIQDGKIGDVVSMQGQFHFVLDDWENDIRVTPALGGGVLYDIGCYCLNFQQLIVDEEVQAVTSFTTKRNEVDVKVAANVQYASGIVGQIDCSFSGHFTQMCSVVGTKGTMRLPYAFRSDLNGHEGVIEIETNEGLEVHRFSANAYEKQIENFVKAVQGAQPNYSLQQIERQVRSLQFIYEKL